VDRAEDTKPFLKKRAYSALGEKLPMLKQGEATCAICTGVGVHPVIRDGVGEVQSNSAQSGWTVGAGSRPQRAGPPQPNLHVLVFAGIPGVWIIKNNGWAGLNIKTG
jgi:hypothetical protein